MKIFKFCSLISFVILILWSLYLFIIPILNKKEEVVVPTLVGLTIDEALNSLDDLSLKSNIVYVDGQSTLMVVDSFPKQNQIVKKGSKINLYVVKEKALVWPDFVNQFYDEKKKEIYSFVSEHNIKLSIVEVTNNDLALGLIVEQNHLPSSLVNVNEELILYVVVHDNLVKMPNLVGMSLEEAINILKEYQLKYYCIYERSVFEFNTVLQQSVSPNTLVIKGNETPITLYVSKAFVSPSSLMYLEITDAVALLEKCQLAYEIHYVKSNHDGNIVIDVDKNYKNEYEEIICLYVSTMK